MGNICSLIKNAVQTHPSGHLVDIVLEVSGFQYQTVPSTELLYNVKRSIKHIASPIQEAEVLRILGNILVKQAKYTPASEALTEAQRQFLDLGNALVLPNAYKAWVTSFTCRLNTLKPLRL